ncbi:MAG: hypothetical protein QOH08_2294 [Chloroflexota bacterium]|jgi:hypothetical protein|nr:hypothetical protein [Chloroflexota bacterium]
MRDALAMGLALVIGLLLASYDLRTDDTGIEVGLLLIASVTLAALAPRRWWLIALCVGLPIPVVEIIVARASLPPGGVAALGVAIVGALIGLAIGRASRAGAAA